MLSPFLLGGGTRMMAMPLQAAFQTVSSFEQRRKKKSFANVSFL